MTNGVGKKSHLNAIINPWGYKYMETRPWRPYTFGNQNITKLIIMRNTFYKYH